MTPRQRLIDTLTTATAKPLTLLVAPAGSGKTVLLSSWLETGDVPGRVAWLTVDRHDNDPKRFWRGVLAALRRSGAGESSSTLASLASPPRDADRDEFLATLVNELGTAGEPVVLVLDDLQEIHDDGVLDDLDYLLRHAPVRLRLVIATRSDPRLSLGRIRLRRELTEVRGNALAFSEEEAAQLLAAAGLDLTSTEVGLLAARTEGWAAGLALAAMSLEGSADPGAQIGRFAGDDRAVADFLVSEVLDRLEPDVREFLLETSVVDQLTADLADAVTEREDSKQLLESLTKMNSFVVPLGSPRRWYRYHNLFRELLRSQLHQRRKVERRELHRRAAEWFAANGHPVEAIRHALIAEDWAAAAALMREHWLDAFLTGEALSMRDLLGQLPRELPEQDAQLALVYAWNHLELNEPREADRYLRIAQERAGPDAENEFADLLAVVTLHRARLNGDLDAAVAAAGTLLGDGAKSKGGSRDPRRRALVLSLLGSAELWTGKLHDARRHLTTGLGLARENGDDYIVLWCLSHLALVGALHGRLRPAAELASSAVDLARRRGWASIRPIAPGYLALAIAQLHWNEPGAMQSASAAASAATGSGVPALGVAVALVEARIRARDEGPSGAQRGLERLEAALDGAAEVRLPAFLDEPVQGVRARLLLQVGEEDDALTTLAAAAPSAMTALVEARVALAEAEPARALEVLAPHVQGASDAFLGTRIEAIVLEAVAHQSRLEREAAAASLERALALAEPDGFRWVLLQAGPPLQELLIRQIRSGTAHRSLVEALISDLGHATENGGPRKEPQLLEPLTEREETVLRYLPTMMSNAEIAAELFVSINTVKAHVKSIYRKLGTTRRKGAVVRGRELGLL